MSSWCFLVFSCDALSPRLKTEPHSQVYLTLHFSSLRLYASSFLFALSSASSSSNILPEKPLVFFHSLVLCFTSNANY